MIRDALLTFGLDVDASEAAGTYNFPNVIDLSVARDIGNGEPLYVVVVVTGGDNGIITGGTAGTIKFQLVSDAQDPADDAGAQSIHLVSTDYITDDAALNDLKLGDTAWCVALPLEGKEPYERYLGLQLVVTTTTTTEGTVSGFLTKDPHGWRAYADAQN